MKLKKIKIVSTDDIEVIFCSIIDSCFGRVWGVYTMLALVCIFFEIYNFVKNDDFHAILCQLWNSKKLKSFPPMISRSFSAQLLIVILEGYEGYIACLSRYAFLWNLHYFEKWWLSQDFVSIMELKEIKIVSTDDIEVNFCSIIDSSFGRVWGVHSLLELVCIFVKFTLSWKMTIVTRFCVNNGTQKK